MANQIALTHNDRIALHNAIESSAFHKDAHIQLHERLYTLQHKDVVFTIWANNYNKRIIKKNGQIIADSETLGNNLIARMDIDNIVIDVIDAYIKQIQQKAYGK